MLSFADIALYPDGLNPLACPARYKDLSRWTAARSTSLRLPGSLLAGDRFRGPGAYTLTLSPTGRIDLLSDGLCSSDDFETIKLRFARFMAAGFARFA